MLLNRGELDGTRLLRAETVNAMTRDQTRGLRPWIAAHGLGFGYGFGVTTSADGSAKTTRSVRLVGAAFTTPISGSIRGTA